MFGGDGSWWIVLLFLFAFNGGLGNGGFGVGGRGQSEISYSFDMNGLESGVRGIQQGLCDGFYAVNTGMLNGFAGVTNAVTGATYDALTTMNANTNALTAGITGLGTQIAQCCCDNRYALANGFAEINYNLAT